VRKVAFDPRTLSGEDRDWWDAWTARADTARAQLLAMVASGRRPEWNDQIWSDLKAWLLDRVFHGKCAYCESRVAPVAFGDAEHFRPKGGVTTIGADGRECSQMVGSDEHPGYYWLAYSWQNLFPSCAVCNTKYKRNFFPVAKTHVLSHSPSRTDPGGLDDLEEPLLLNPLVDDPSDHLVFGPLGTVVAKNGSARGKAAIKYYGLDRGDLETARKTSQEFALMSLSRAVVCDDPSAYQACFEEARSGRREHSAAVLSRLSPWADPLRRSPSDVEG